MYTFCRRRDRGSVALIVSIIVVVLVVVVLVFYLVSHRPPGEVRNFQDLVMRVDKLNGQISDREGKIMDLVRKYNVSHPNAAFDTTGIAAMGLSPEQAEILSKRVAQEKDVSYRGMLQEVIDLNGQVSKLSQEMDQIRAQLPKPYAVKQGDSYYKICLEWLTEEKGLPEDEATKLIERANVSAELLPGFEVWNYYKPPESEGDKAIFGTFVTQGRAKLSPNALARATKRRIDTEFHNLIQARNQKEEEVKDLETRRAELQDQIKGLDEERKNMMSQMSEMAQKNETLAKQLNSVYYVVGTFKDLAKQGVIKKPTLGKWQSADMDKIQNPSALDLRADTRISFTAASIGLGRIGTVLLFPRSYDEGADFKVTVSEDKQTVTIDLLKREKFQLAKLAIAVDS